MTVVINSRFFDLATPDPNFSGCRVELEDQLPGRPTEGMIEIATFFSHLQLVVTERQKAGSVNGDKLFDEFKRTKTPVLGPNVGQFLYENQHLNLIPKNLQHRVVLVFWGRIYRHSNDARCVWYLCWDGSQWAWGYGWVGRGFWFEYDYAVVLARKS